MQHVPGLLICVGQTLLLGYSLGLSYLCKHVHSNTHRLFQQQTPIFRSPWYSFFLLLSLLSSWLLETDVGKAPFLMQGTPIYPLMANVLLCNSPVPKVEDNHISPAREQWPGCSPKTKLSSLTLEALTLHCFSSWVICRNLWVTEELKSCLLEVP